MSRLNRKQRWPEKWILTRQSNRTVGEEGLVDTRLLTWIYSRRRNLNRGLTMRNKQALRANQRIHIQEGWPTKVRLLTLVIIRETSSNASNFIQPESRIRKTNCCHMLSDKLNSILEESSEFAAAMASLKAEIVSSRISGTINGRFRVIYATSTSWEFNAIEWLCPK